jgi:Family of unknown function (DUF5684)
MITRKQRGSPAGGGWLTAVLLAWLSVAPLSATDIQLDVLKCGTDVFTNVTIYGQTQTDLFIKHSRGFGNVKISSLDDATLRLLKPEVGSTEDQTAAASSGRAATTVGSLKAKLAGMQWKTPSEAEVQGLLSQVRPGPDMMAKALAVAVIAYLLFCCCLKLICLNAGDKAGLLIWIPVLQMFPLLRAAKMSAWWFVAFLIPLVGVLAHIVWCVKISKACGKGALVALLLVLPGTNLLAFLYLAISKNNSQPVENAVPIRRHTAALGEA